MKNKFIKTLAMVLSATMIVSSSFPAFAYDVDEHDNSVESTQYQNTADEDFSNVTNVFAQLGSEYKVTIPKVIVLSGASKDARYYVKVAGDIAGYEKVKVVPEDSFKLFAKNKADETAIVNQDKTVWTVHDFDTDANGKVEASSITAGAWQGTFNFNINLENIEQTSTTPELPQDVLGDIVIPPVDEWTENTFGEDITLKVGETGYPEITLNDNDILADCTVTSSDESIAKIVNRNIKALKVGTSKITISYGEKNYIFNVNVVENTDMKVHVHIAGDVVKENEVASTCTEDGSYDEVVYCKTCNKELSRTTTMLNALGHDWKLTASNDATCEMDSLEAYVCTRCSETDIKHNVKATGHVADTSKDTVKAATCTTQGYTTHTCKNCGKTYSDTPVKELGHNYVNGRCTRCQDFDMSKMEAGLYTVSGTGENKTYTQTVSWQQIINNGWFRVTNGKLIYNGADLVQGTSKYKNEIKGFLVLPNTVTSIDDQAFYNLDNLTGLYLPASLTTVRTFNWIKNITNIEVDKNSTNFKVVNGALYSYDGTILYLVPKTTTGTFVIEEGCTEIAQLAFWEAKYNSIVFPSSLKTIKNYAFRGMQNISEIFIPASVTDIGVGIVGYSKISAINIDSNNKNYTSYNGIIYTQDMKTIIVCPPLKTGVVNIPETVNKISNSAFESTNIEKITVPESVTYIGEWAFANSTKLTSVNIPSKITRIEKGVFAGLYITAFTIPANVTYIGEKNTFKGKLKSLTFADTSYQWKATMISGGISNNNIPTDKFSVTDAAKNAIYANNSSYYRWYRQ